MSCCRNLKRVRPRLGVGGVSVCPAQAHAGSFTPRTGRGGVGAGRRGQGRRGQPCVLRAERPGPEWHPGGVRASPDQGRGEGHLVGSRQKGIRIYAWQHFKAQSGPMGWRPPKFWQCPWGRLVKNCTPARQPLGVQWVLHPLSSVCGALEVFK